MGTGKRVLPSHGAAVPHKSIDRERPKAMSNVIRHPRFVLEDEQDTLHRLEALIDRLHETNECLDISARLFVPLEHMKLRSRCDHAIAEIEEMKRAGDFTRERLKDLAAQLGEVLGILWKKQRMLGIAT